MKQRFVPTPHSNAKIWVFLVLFIAWGFLVGYSKAIIIFKGESGEGDARVTECTYFNGFVFATEELGKLKGVTEEDGCPILIDTHELDAWTPT